MSDDASLLERLLNSVHLRRGLIGALAGGAAGAVIQGGDGSPETHAMAVFAAVVVAVAAWLLLSD